MYKVTDLLRPASTTPCPISTSPAPSATPGAPPATPRASQISEVDLQLGGDVVSWFAEVVVARAVFRGSLIIRKQRALEVHRYFTAANKCFFLGTLQQRLGLKLKLFGLCIRLDTLQRECG